jgi:AmmeMemoRadiSam system protein A
MLPPSESSLPSVPEPSGQNFTSEERKLLVQIAHRAILSHLEGHTDAGRKDTAVDDDFPITPSPRLVEPHGVFTTLYLNGMLRGCVGYPSSLLPLYRSVMETALAAAFDDPRFDPLTLPQAQRIKISLSVLSALRPISADDVVVGSHGLMITDGARRGLLLPQVPVEHGWDRITFLEQTSRKAGLASDVWKKGANIEAFTAEVFGDHD